MSKKTNMASDGASSPDDHRDHGMRSDIADAAQREFDGVKTELSGLADTIRTEGSRAGHNVWSLMVQELDRRKDDMSASLVKVTDAVRDVSRGDSGSSQVLDQAVLLMEDVSSGMADSSVADMGQTVSRISRQNPVAFTIGCVLAGVALGRFLVASGDTTDRDGHSGRFDNDDDADGAFRSQFYGADRQDAGARDPVRADPMMMGEGYDGNA